MWLVFASLASSTNAEVIANDAMISPPDIQNKQYLYLAESIPDGEGLFQINIQGGSSSQFQFSAFGIAEAYRLFSAPLGAVIDPAFASSNIPIVANDISLPASVQTFALNESRHFAYWDDRSFNDVPDANDNYGWVLITRTFNGLESSASATAIGRGIAVGSNVQIPEPKIAAIMSALAMMTPWLRRRHR